MIYGSVCSGIEAASVAWHPLGWRAAFLSEIEKFPRAVLAHHYPGVPLHGDFTTIEAGQYEPIDLLVGGTPCQSFSIAGLRGGLADDRGNLALEYLRLADRLRPRWLVWENVPGVLSSNGGRDFGAILGGMVELGYGFAYRVLDAQHFGVPQRRRRVFVVGYLGDWRRAAAVLFERHSLQGHPAPRRETGEGIAPCLNAGSSGGGRKYGTCADTAEGLVTGTLNANGKAAGSATQQDAESGLLITGQYAPDVALALSASHTASGRQDPSAETFIAHTLRGEGFDAGEDECGRGTPLVPVAFEWQRGSSQNLEMMENFAPALIKSQTPPVAFNMHKSGNDGLSLGISEGRIDCMRAFEKSPFAVQPAPHMAVRRLTPRECERLQGFPDDYTLVPYRGKPAADGPRYKALGNSMAVPVMRWIGERIQMVETLRLAEAA
jgi:DNA (cytosine-5)-methyltransferase 1